MLILLKKENINQQPDYLHRRVKEITYDQIKFLCSPENY